MEIKKVYTVCKDFVQDNKTTCEVIAEYESVVLAGIFLRGVAEDDGARIEIDFNNLDAIWSTKVVKEFANAKAVYYITEEMINENGDWCDMCGNSLYE